MNEEEFIIKFYSYDNEEQFLKDVYSNMRNIENDNKMLRRSNKNAYQEFKKKHNSLYKQRIDKAIEYIKEIDEKTFTDTEHYVEILNFLEGDK